MGTRRWLIAAFTITTLLSCSQTSVGEPASRASGMSITGTIGFQAAPATAQSSATDAASTLPPEVVPGQLVVKYRGAPPVRPQGLGVALSLAQQPAALEQAAVYQAAGLDARQTIELAQELSSRPDVEYAEPVRILRPTATSPSDSSYPRQWNLAATSSVRGAIDLPSAWDTTTGSATTVAVLDTGLLFRAASSGANHPDLDPARILPGYDFISNASCTNGLACSGDGDGPDGDPYDVGGDLPDGASSYHGTFVAGILGAATDNRQGMAGVNWKTRILPVRVLGQNGGTSTDIVKGLLFAAGVTAPGVPGNPHPADVINLSLGGPGSCPADIQEAIDAALGGPRKPVIVVAAGNDGLDAKNAFPANCQGVVTVGASDQFGKRTGYSNYGAYISVLAPGGDTAQSYRNTATAGGILGLTRHDHNSTFGYEYGAGTSFAAPHVAGVVALMRSVNPSLSASAAVSLLRSTARTLDANDCRRETGADCGAGIINAAKAVSAAQAWNGTEPGAEAPSLRGTYVGAFRKDTNGDLVAVAHTYLDGGTSNVAYRVENVPGGEHYLIAFRDDNDNGMLDQGEFFAEYPTPVRAPRHGVDLYMTRDSAAALSFQRAQQAIGKLQLKR